MVLSNTIQSHQSLVCFFVALVPLSLLLKNTSSSTFFPADFAYHSKISLRTTNLHISFQSSTLDLNNKMHYTTLLTLALSAAVTTPVLAAPAPVLSSNSSFSDTNTTTTDLRTRGWFDKGPEIGSFADQFCTGKPVDNGNKLVYGGKYKCVKWTPSTDNMGIMWGGARALGVSFYSDNDCQKAATKTYWAPTDYSDNGKGKANICLSAKYAVGGPVGSVIFIPNSYYGFAEHQKAWAGSKDAWTSGGKAPHG
ncbi:MAG: hypothetical protein Q9212_005631 [Teloschistes hypoglaucus]